MQDRDKFYEADDEAFNTVAPELEDMFGYYGYTTTITKTEDGDRVDAYITATKNDKELQYVVEIKKRENEYTFSRFWGDEEIGGRLGGGLFIKEKKIKSLKDRSKNRLAYYLTYFPDGYLAMWRIDENTKYGEQKNYYDKYNVYRGEKEWQINKTLKLHDANIIWSTKDKIPIQTIK